MLTESHVFRVSFLLMHVVLQKKGWFENLKPIFKIWKNQNIIL